MTQLIAKPRVKPSEIAIKVSKIIAIISIAASAVDFGSSSMVAGWLVTELGFFPFTEPRRT